jgi:hypothetical protein
MQEGLGHVVVEDGDAFVHGIFLFPRAGLHFLEARAHHHLHVLGAQAACRAAAVHGGVATAEHDDVFLDRRDVAEGHAGQPVDADVDVGGSFLAAGHLQVAPARCAAAHEDGVPVLRHQGLHRLHTLAGLEVHAQVQHIAGFFVDDFFGQTETRDLRADEAAGLVFTVVHRHRITLGGQVARHRQRRRPGTHAHHLLAVGAAAGWASGPTHLP